MPSHRPGRSVRDVIPDTNAIGSLQQGDGISFFALSALVKQECGILDSDDVRTASLKLDAAIAALRLEGGDVLWVRAQLAPLVSIDAPPRAAGLVLLCDFHHVVHKPGRRA